MVRTADRKFSASEASHSSSVTDRMPSKRVATRPGVVDQDVDTAAALGGRGDQRARAVRGGEIGGDEGGRARRFQRLQFGAVVPGACDDVGARGGERLADRQADALARAGDDATLSVRFMSMPPTVP